MREAVEYLDGASSETFAHLTLTFTNPTVVWRMALLTRFVITCSMRIGSHMTVIVRESPPSPSLWMMFVPTMPSSHTSSSNSAKF